MNTNIYRTGVFALLGLILAMGAPAAQAAGGHEGHDHGKKKAAAPAPKKDLEGLFDEDDHKQEKGHEDHAHGEKKEAGGHEGHDHGSEGGICPEHGVPEERDALCQGGHIGELMPGQGMLVRLQGADAATRAGLALSTPERLSQGTAEAIPARVEFNRDRHSRVASPAGGLVRQVKVRPGDRVKKGQVLAEISMPEISSLKAGLFQARARQIQTEAAWAREKDLLARGISARQDFEQAEAEMMAARGASGQYRAQLLAQGLTPEALEQLAGSGDSSAVVALRAPFSGRVVEVKAAAGESAVPGEPLFVLADLETLWLELSVPETRIHEAVEGAEVEAVFSGLPGRVFTGRVFEPGVALDERSRTLRVLAEVKNPGERLKAGMFGEARLLGAQRRQVPAVPVAALQTIDGKPFVFIAKEADLFELRRVSTGAKAAGLISVTEGLEGTEQVVSSQGFALKSEVLKARLGASCADH